MPAYVRPMERGDVAQVTEIDREAFPTEWPAPNFKHELENRLARYIVACDAERTVEKPVVSAPPEKGFARLAYRVKRLFGDNHFFGNERRAADEHHVIGFASFWLMADEAHITTIASRTSYRRQGIGELLLISIIEMATRMRARMITLEVRISNTVAQRLYSKYGFTRVGVRRGYYIDNREDGLLMSIEDTSSTQFLARFSELREAHSLRWGTARYQAGQ